MRRLWLIFAQAVTVAVAILFVLQTLKPGGLSGASITSGGGVQILQEAPGNGEVRQVASFSSAAQRALPSVVHIYTTQEVRAPKNPLLNDPFFRHFFGDRFGEEKQQRSGLGSGVVVSSSGYILTNNHVVEGADQIEVATNDGRKLKAEVVGTDPESDLAVLKVAAEAKLDPITFAQPRSLKVGDVVLAIGNPFGVGQTVTMGIISATGRNQLGLNTYEDFIQTDAAINPGNSGGALVDASGNLIGINTAIFSKSGGSQGIGFAIPVKLALEVMKAIIEHGQVIRGWLGIEVQPLTPELAESFGLEGRPGIVVAGIYRDSPAQRAALQPGDIILSIDGEPAGDGRRSMNQVARTQPGEKITIEVLRGGEPLELTAEIGVRPPAEVQQ